MCGVARANDVKPFLGTSHARGVEVIPAYTTTRSMEPNLIAIPFPIMAMPISPKQQCSCDAFSVVMQRLPADCSTRVTKPNMSAGLLVKGREKLQ
jgi:hypothetical protein